MWIRLFGLFCGNGSPVFSECCEHSITHLIFWYGSSSIDNFFECGFPSFAFYCFCQWSLIYLFHIECEVLPRFLLLAVNKNCHFIVLASGKRAALKITITSSFVLTIYFFSEIWLQVELLRYKFISVISVANFREWSTCSNCGVPHHCFVFFFFSFFFVFRKK